MRAHAAAAGKRAARLSTQVQLSPVPQMQPPGWHTKHDAALLSVGAQASAASMALSVAVLHVGVELAHSCLASCGQACRHVVDHASFI